MAAAGLMLLRRLNLCRTTSLALIETTSSSSSSLIQQRQQKRTLQTFIKGEDEWLKEYSKKLIEDAKNEKGIPLTVDPTKPQLFFDKAEELKTANETVKKLLSLQFAKKVDYKRYEEELAKKLFKNMPLEDDSLEIKIAIHTLSIKRICNFLQQHGGNPKKVLFVLYRMIHRRDRYLCQLFYKDNKRYEQVIQLIGLNNYEIKEEYPFRRITKYAKFTSEVRQEAENMRMAKLNKQREQFETEKTEFFAERNQILADIVKELKELGIKDAIFPEFVKQ